MAAQTKRKSRRRADTNQLCLLDYKPPENAATPRLKAKAPQHTDALAMSDAASVPNVLTPKQAAIYLNLSIATLKSWRAKKTGPVVVKRGARMVGYRPADLDAFMSGQ